MGQAFGKWFSNPRGRLSSEEARAFEIAGTLAVNTSQSGHVWLPLRFVDGRPTIAWQHEWRIEDFD